MNRAFAIPQKAHHFALFCNNFCSDKINVLIQHNPRRFEIISNQELTLNAQYSLSQLAKMPLVMWSVWEFGGWILIQYQKNSIVNYKMQNCGHESAVNKDKSRGWGRGLTPAIRRPTLDSLCHWLFLVWESWSYDYPHGVCINRVLGTSIDRPHYKYLFLPCVELF